ncbi:LCP family protein [Yinghuangia soli]|uniref:LCP family protein n=1 Tax=Yinghuangia soli TaxID=2908204 RepID=A0AA41Q6X6_9ACTN|nr:LCP family protein [Yinghuangia soli]MCF2532683.1 LCP family protein [Yinghuangia soli]
MASGHRRPQGPYDPQHDQQRVPQQRDGGLGALDDADIADMWVMDPDTGSYRLRTPDETAAGAAAQEPDRDAYYGDDDPEDESAYASEPEPESEPVRSPGRRATRTAPPPRSKAKRRLKRTAISLGLILLVLAGSLYGYYEYLNSRIQTDKHSADPDRVAPAEKDEKGRKQMNILLIGSDSRIGEGNTKYGLKGQEGHADTTLLLHLSADRSNATVVSIPRDTMVYQPPCLYDGGKKTQPARELVMFNESLLKPGGPPCTVATVERMLRVQIDHWLMIEFNGVKEMTKAVGGVPLNFCRRMHDPVDKEGGTGLDVGPGVATLEGESALQFLRARHVYPAESDLARIEGQKKFMMALAREIKTSATWKDPAALFKIAQAATGNIKVDEGLNRLEKLVDLGQEIKKVPEKRMAFTTLPYEPYPANTNRVQPKQPQANNLWAAIRGDVAFTKGDPTAPAQPIASNEPPAQTEPPPPTVDPATMTVSVRNTTNVPKAQAVATQLSAAGYKAKPDQAKSATVRANSSVVYPKGKQDAARQLAAAVGIPVTALEEAASATATTFEVVIGLDFPGLNDPAPAKTPTRSGKPGTGAPASQPPQQPPASQAPKPPTAEELQQNTADDKSCVG